MESLHLGLFVGQPLLVTRRLGHPRRTHLNLPDLLHPGVELRARHAVGLGPVLCHLTVEVLPGLGALALEAGRELGLQALHFERHVIEARACWAVPRLGLRLMTRRRGVDLRQRLEQGQREGAAIGGRARARGRLAGSPELREPQPQGARGVHVELLEHLGLRELQAVAEAHAALRLEDREGVREAARAQVRRDHLVQRPVEPPAPLPGLGRQAQALLLSELREDLGGSGKRARQVPAPARPELLPQPRRGAAAPPQSLRPRARYAVVRESVGGAGMGGQQNTAKNIG